MLVTVLTTNTTFYCYCPTHTYPAAFLTQIKERFHSLLRKETQQEIKYAMPVKVNILKIRGLGSQDRLSCCPNRFLKTLDGSQRVSARDFSHPPPPTRSH